MRIRTDVLWYAGGGLVGLAVLTALLVCFSGALVRLCAGLPRRARAGFAPFNLLLILLGTLAGSAAVAVAAFPSYTPFATALVGTGIVLFCTRPPLKEGQGRVVAELGGFAWDKNDFCRHWLITGQTGTGKTLAALTPLQDSVFRLNPHRKDGQGNVVEYGWGGVCIDDKGTYWEFEQAMAEYYGRRDDLILLQTRPEWADPGWKPPAVFNPLSDHRIPANTYADAIATCYRTVSEGGRSNDFFTNQATQHIGMGIELARMLGRFPCLHEINDILQTPDLLEGTLQKIERRLSKGEIAPDQVGRAKAVIAHFNEKYLNQAPEQLSGVKSTIGNYLFYFSTPDVVDVFGQPSGNTVEFSDVERGKIFCISMPQKYQVERRYIGALLKVLFLQHSLRRFDQRANRRDKANLLVLWADEAQRFLSGREDAVVLREARSAIVASTQMHEGFYPVMGREVADVFMGNLSNRVIFRAASRASAEASAHYIGHREVWKKSYSYGKGGRSVSRHKDEEFKIKPMSLLSEKKFPKFTAVVYHCSKGYRRRKLSPLFVTTLERRVRETFEKRSGPARA
jgi:hypothetical protein